MVGAAHSDWSQGNPSTPCLPSCCTDEGMVWSRICITTQDLIPRQLSLYITLLTSVTVRGFLFPKGLRGSREGAPSLRDPKTTFGPSSMEKSNPPPFLGLQGLHLSGVCTPTEPHLQPPRTAKGEPWPYIWTPLAILLRTQKGKRAKSGAPSSAEFPSLLGPRKGRLSPLWAPCPGTSGDEVSPQLQETGGP